MVAALASKRGTIMLSHLVRALTLVTALLVLGVLPASGAATAPPPLRLGYCGGDDWEPAMAVQGSYVVVAITHYVGDTTCDPASGNAAAIYTQVSSDGGAHFGTPHAVWTQPVGGISYPEQADPSVAIDPSGAVYVSFLGRGANGGHTDIIVAKSTDHGMTFGSPVKANAKDCKNCD